MMVLALIALVWAGFWALGLPAHLRWLASFLILLAALLAQLVLPEGNGLRNASGGDWRLFAALLVFGAIAGIYRIALGAIRQRIEPAPTQGSRDMSEQELQRYSRHIMLREIGGPGQRRLRAARILVIGAGGLGAPAMLYLGASGAGRIGVIDPDKVELSNLQRQVIFRDIDIGKPKVFAAEQSITAQNPYVDMRPYHRALTADIAEELFRDYDVILDGTDNFATRQMVNKAAVAAQKPLVSGALSQWEGQVGLYDPASGGPCYACAFPKAPLPGQAPSCAQAGVAGPLPGIIGAMMAMEAVKHITGAGRSLRGRLILYDALEGLTREFEVERRPACEVCGTAPTKESTHD